MANLQTLRGYLREEMRKDPNGRIQSDALLNRNINSAVEQICADFNYEFPVCDGENTASTVISQAAYTLPSDFVRIEQGTVNYDSSPLDLADYRWLKNTFVNLAQDGTPTFYYLRNGALNLFPRPSAIKTLNFSYRKGPADMVNNTDNCFLSDVFNKAITFYSSYLCFNDFDTDSALQALQNYNLEMQNINTRFNFQDETQYHFDFETING